MARKNLITGKFSILGLLFILLLFAPIAGQGQTPGFAQGVDVSDNNSDPDKPVTAFTVDQWKTIKSQWGLSFAIVKATQGTGIKNKTFPDNAINAAGANLIVGVFHYASPDKDADAAAEARFFLTTAGQYLNGNYLPPALDIEVSGSLSKTALTNWVLTWLSTVESESPTHVVPMVYTYKTFLSDYLNADDLLDKSTGKAYPMWIADQKGDFARPWLFKQFQGDPKPAMLTGFKKGFDRDEFDGSESALQTFMGQRSTAPLADLTITAGTQSATPVTVTVGANMAVSCSEDNSGNAAAGANDVTVWLSPDPVLTLADTYLGKISFPALGANVNSLINGNTVQIPAGTPAGSYYLFFWADGNKVVQEKDEDNNFASVIVNVTAGGPVAALTLTAVPQCNGTASSVSLNWNSVPNAASYAVYRNNTLYTSGISGTQFTNTNVTAGQSYSYYVVAQTNAGDMKSNTASTSAPNCASSVLPGAFVLSSSADCNGTASKVHLSWTVSVNATSYDIYRDNLLISSGISGTSFDNTTVTAGNTYAYYVTARNTSGTLNSNTQSQTAVSCSGVPGLPVLSLAASCNGSKGQIKLDWTAAANATAYDIYRNNTFYTTVKSGTTYTDNVVTAGLVYTYYIRATNGSNGTNSAYQSATASNCSGLTLPAQPALVVQSSCSGGVSKVLLNWGADANATAFDVYKNYQYYATVTGAQYIDYTITPGTDYLYNVQAKNDAGAKDSPIQSAHALDCTPNFPSAPVMTLTPFCDGTTGEVTVNWTTSNNAVAYDVYRDGQLIYTAFGDQRSYTDNTSAPGSSHTYYVAAGNGSGLTNSNSGSLTVPNCLPPPTITAVSPMNGQTGSVVTISGTHFDSSTSVTFGGIPAQTVSISSATQLQATIGSGAAGNIVLSNNGGTASYAGFNFLFTLPANNFQVSAISATCRGSASGAVAINAGQVLAYTATLTGNSINRTESFTAADTLGNLPAGTYHLCIQVTGQPTFQQCYDLTVSEPKDLAVYSTVSPQTQTLQLQLAGGTVYHIQLNGVNRDTTGQQITLPLQNGLNRLEVTTDKPCQGTYQTVIDLLDKIVPFPDPFEKVLNINLGNDPIKQVHFEVYGLSNGKSLYQKDMNGVSGVIGLDLQQLESGIYILHIRLDGTERIFKIIKK
ncbi:GH25 family lysozyme [Mucilaginibacter sp. AW1-3]